MITVLMQVEGVLAHPVEDTPITEGMMLYRALRNIGTIAMYSDRSEESARYWLQRERLDDPLSLYIRQFLPVVINMCRLNHDLSMMVSADPGHVKTAYRMGVQALLFVHPSYGRPEWRPDYEEPKRPWDEMVNEIVAKRLEKTDAGSSS